MLSGWASDCQFTKTSGFGKSRQRQLETSERAHTVAIHGHLRIEAINCINGYVQREYDSSARPARHLYRFKCQVTASNGDGYAVKS